LSALYNRSQKHQVSCLSWKWRGTQTPVRLFPTFLGNMLRNQCGQDLIIRLVLRSRFVIRPCDRRDQIVDLVSLRRPRSAPGSSTEGSTSRSARSTAGASGTAASISGIGDPGPTGRKSEARRTSGRIAASEPRD